MRRMMPWTRLGAIVIAIWLISGLPLTGSGIDSAIAGDSTKVANSFHDSTATFLDLLVFENDSLRIDNRQLRQTARIDSAAGPAVLPDSFWRNWKVWAGSFLAGVVTGWMLK